MVETLRKPSHCAAALGSILSLAIGTDLLGCGLDQKQRTLSGQVVDTASLPIAGAAIKTVVSWYDPSTDYGGTDRGQVVCGISDAYGQYNVEVADVVGGTYQIVAGKDGFLAGDCSANAACVLQPCADPTCSLPTDFCVAGAWSHLRES